MKINRLVLAAAAAFCGDSASVMAQESSVYITQVNQAAPLTNSRPSVSPDAYSRVVGNASGSIPNTPTANAAPGAPAPFGVGLTTPEGLSNAVNAAALSGSGAGTRANNVAVINQFGASNTGSIDQTGVNNFGYVGQIGLNNQANSIVAGDNNRTAQIQAGLSGNNSSIGIVGSGNTVTNGQLGGDNQSNIRVDGNNYNLQVNQIGVGLSYGIQATSTIPNVKNFSVTQVGIGSGAVQSATTLPAGVTVSTQRGR